MVSRTSQKESSFQISIGLAFVLGSIAWIVFNGLVAFGPLDYQFIKKFCWCHPVAFATVELFFIAVAALAMKWMKSHSQARLAVQSGAALSEIAMSEPEEGLFATGEQKSQWFQALWGSQELKVRTSWLGARVEAILQRQLKRRNAKHLDDDISELADRDSDRQHDSYALIRIVTWAMPMLGFLGTVLGISDTLGMMDAQSLASGSQEAMNKLTDGLYVAFDTTAIGIVLTMVAMFVQFVVNRKELALLSDIDNAVADALQSCLTDQELATDSSNLGQTLTNLTAELLKTLESVVVKQSELWQGTIETANQKWHNLSTTAAETIEATLTRALQTTLQAQNDLALHRSEDLARVYAEGAALVDSRMKDCRSELLSYADSIAKQQEQLVRCSENLVQLVEKNDLILNLEQPLQATLERLTDVARFHEVAVCMTEAVAVLGTQLERNGVLGRISARRSNAKQPPMPRDETESSASAALESEPITIPLRPNYSSDGVRNGEVKKRRAG